MKQPTEKKSPIPEFVDRCVAQLGAAQEQTLAHLHAIHREYGYLPPEALERLSEVTGRPLDELWGVATFYDQFRFTPAGRHRIRVCIGTACHVKGAQTVFDEFRRHLKIADNQDTDPDRLFTVEKVACLGCCMLAPAVQIDDLVYGYLSAEKVPSVLRDFLQQVDGEHRPASSGAAPGGAEGQIHLCLDTSCRAVGSHRVYREFERAIREEKLPVRLKSVSCQGVSYLAPMVEINGSDGRRFVYGKVLPADARSILRRHFRPRAITSKLRWSVSGFLDSLVQDRLGEPPVRFETSVRDADLTEYLERQVQVATEQAGVCSPLDLEEYERNKGFEAFRLCLGQKTPRQVIEEIETSGLRGRGGGGYPTFLKWAAVHHSQSPTKYIVCNGDEGDPGAFMDRMLMESYPFRILEGMAIAAWTVGARRGFLYIRDEYPLAVARMTEAIEICRRRGILGSAIEDSEFSLDLEICTGAGAFVCGEETALMASIEGRRPMPRLRPPYPSRQGLWGMPTLVNNVETYALVPWILANGAVSLTRFGTPRSRGTKVFALAGKVVRGGLIEVPMGVTIRQVVQEIGGGIAGGRTFKAVQIGGPSGGCLPASLAEVPIDYESLTGAGAMMGSGGLVVLDEHDCMVDIARYFLEFTQQQSCGKCTFCRVGTKRMLEILQRLCSGQGQKGDIEKLEELARLIRQNSLCGLGMTAPNPVLSTITHFREEYEAHINGRCPAARCRPLIHYSINEKCIGCTRCAQHCPAEAIQMRPYQQHEINQSKCIRCGTCKSVCPAEAVDVG